MLDIKLRRNPEYSQERAEEAPRYFFELDLTGIIVGGEKARIPVFWGLNRFPHILLKEIYSVEIAGMRLEKGNLESLKATLQETVLGMIGHTSLPHYLFIPSGAEAIPVYCLDGELMARCGDGPQFSGQDVSHLWRRIGEYLISSRRIRSLREMRVRALSPKDLRLYPPQFVLFHQDGEEVLIPIFYDQGEEGRLTIKYETIEFPSHGGGYEEVFDLRRQVADHLTEEKRLDSPYDLKIGEVSEKMRRDLEGILERQDFCLTYYPGEEEKAVKAKLPVFKRDAELVAVQREDTNLHTLHFGHDRWDIKDRISRDLFRSGIIHSSDHLMMERL